ncbi:hypothetical protein LQW54_007222 [Pestalotiopsis sp. IQ-011]
MAPRKRTVTTPDGNTDDDSDTQPTQAVPTGLGASLETIDKIRAKRTKVRQGIERDFNKDLSDSKTRINQHYETEKAKRIEFAHQQIRRLSEAMEKKAACEDRILKMIAMMANEADKLSSIMHCVLGARQQLVLEAASSDKYKERKR